VCVKFYAVGSTNVPCNPDTEDAAADSLGDGLQPTDDCTADESCTLSGSCVPRSSETRYCMRKCGDDGDCRDEYHCRDYALMLEYGGEPVTEPGTSTDAVQPFCAAAPQ
jgi:hypothetical protein